VRGGNLALRARRLYERFIAPLVLGGAVKAGPAIGARAALSLDGAEAAVDLDVRSLVDVARVRVARRLVPLDLLDGPDLDEWALAAALHDLLYALHPDLDAPLHRGASERLLDHVACVLDRVRPPGSVKAAVSRHTFLGRMFELERTDTAVSWWTGSRTFAGREPPARITALPRLRRVHSARSRLPLARMIEALPAPRRARYAELLAHLLERTPLTDLATASRGSPPFAWTGASLGLLSGPVGRVIGLRALALGRQDAVDVALGCATRPFLEAAAWGTVARVCRVASERAVVAAMTGREPAADLSDGRFAMALGAVAALRERESDPDAFGADPIVLARLGRLAASAEGSAVAELLRGLPVGQVSTVMSGSTTRRGGV
jgi:hypothetical protein